MRGDEMRVVNLFPDLMINIRSNVVRIDRMVPLGPDRTLVEWRGLGVKGDDDAMRAVRDPPAQSVLGTDRAQSARGCARR